MSDAVLPGDLRTRSGKQPNILMLFSDQHNSRMAGFMGSKVVQTPNLDKLAAGGATFTNAYCTSPLCSPSRQSYMSGLYCHRIDMWNNTAAMPEDTVTWAHMLSLAGYETSLLGKMHFNGYQKMYGFDRRPVLEGNEAGEHFYSWGLRTSHEWTDPLPYRSGPGEDGLKPQIRGARADVPERQKIFQKDLEVLDGTLAMLREKAADKTGQPWAICSSFVLPHPPYRARPDILERYRGKGDLPFNPRGECRDTCDRYVQEFFGNPGELPDDVIRSAREVYFSLVTEFDEYAGKILDCLEESGLADDTVVLYFSDHGEMAGEHGLWAKVTLLETSSRVPLVIRWPGHIQPGTRIDTPVSLVDLFPTFLELAGVALPEPLFTDGYSLLPLLGGDPGKFERDGVFCEFEGEGWNHPRAFVRVGKYKYVYNHTADSRLYDLEADPNEMHDLSGKSEYAETEAKLKARLLADWDPDDIERRVIRAQARRKIARNKNVCKDIGW